MAAFAKLAGMEVVHVPYRGGGPAMTDLVAGNVAMAFASAAAATQHVLAGRLRALGAAGLRRISALPDLPTISELGYPGFDWDEWNGLWTVAGTPAASVAKPYAATVFALNQPDVQARMIFRVTPAGEWSVVAEYDGEPNGLAFHREGWVAITDAKRGLLRLNPETGEVSPLLPRARREIFRGVNDCTFAKNGDLFFTDQGQTGLQDPAGRVYCLRAGASQANALISNVPSPNGLVLTGDAHTLYVAATRDNAIWRVPITEDGGVIRVGRFIAMSGGLAGPDGMAMDVEGNIAVAHAGMGSVWIFSRLGEPLLRIRSPRGLATTNVCFGGPENCDLFITESDSGSALRTRWAHPGAVLFSHC